ncbi:hypothetical protein Vadar_018575 [Vaccinium darrowii]|uniref:Uncharacterized protein n=1 Tax=Vaccinium darrowii TaxID=229202 RepID=A0ACB7YYE0_9ERIC|nr:hypothetical protein Vadar_018575 [Vaccinium darrowii]
MKNSSPSSLNNSSSSKASPPTKDEEKPKGSAVRTDAKPKKLVILKREPSIDINQSAEEFINKFKQQLLIQRLESIENYEQMLARGT